MLHIKHTTTACVYRCVCVCLWDMGLFDLGTGAETPEPNYQTTLHWGLCKNGKCVFLHECVCVCVYACVCFVIESLHLSPSD